MKKLLTLLVIFLGLSLSVGCTNSAGLVDSASDRQSRIASIMDVNSRQVVDDWDEIWFLDDASKMTLWHVSIGN